MTTTTIRAYTSTVLAVVPSLLCAIGALIIAALVLTLVGSPAPVTGSATIVIAITVAALVIMTARVQISISVNEIAYRSGFAPWRRIPVAAVANAECRTVGAGAIVGIGIPPTVHTSRHLVRAGDALHLRITTGEHIWLSIAGTVPGDLLPGARSTPESNNNAKETAA